MVDSFSQWPYWPYLFPPLLGALIGYVTNYIAIRMLFRPLKAWHVLGLRVPLTPGIIPSRRGDLARKMGEMVGEHLLTPQDVGRALEKPAFRHTLYQAIATRIDTVLQRPLGPLISLIPAHFHPRCEEILGLLNWKIQQRLDKLLHAEKTRQQLQDFCHQALNGFLQQDLGELLPAERYDAWRDQLILSLNARLQDPQTVKAMDRRLDGWLDQFMESTVTPAQLLGEEGVNIIHELIRKELPGLTSALAKELLLGKNREALEQKAREMVGRFIDSIEGLSALIGALFDMEKLYARLPQVLDRGLGDVTEWLKSKSFRKRLERLLQHQVEELLQRPFHSWIEQLSYEQVRDLRTGVRQRLIALLQHPELHNRLWAFIDDVYSQHRDRALKELLPLKNNGTALNEVAATLSTSLLRTLHQERFRQRCDDWLTAKTQYWLYQRPIGELAAWLPSDAREELCQGLLEQLVGLMKKEVPPLVTSLDICRIVEDKVNSLDLLQVEGLLMGIMKEQFKYINLFGALLGFLIGLLNLLWLGGI
ncbi:MAG: DUF445 family protein [Desulfuromonadaceae bacterium]|nr:DUF445 family protein [Desulfuromonadaceae bacterium]